MTTNKQTVYMYDIVEYAYKKSFMGVQSQKHYSDFVQKLIFSIRIKLECVRYF